MCVGGSAPDIEELQLHTKFSFLSCKMDQGAYCGSIKHHHKIDKTQEPNPLVA